MTRTKKDREELQRMRRHIIPVYFSEDEILILHALAVLGDGRRPFTKLIKRRISPIAKELIKSQEYAGERKP